MKGDSQMIIYQTQDGKTKLEVRLEGETVWLTQKLMAELFQTTIPNVNMHLKSIFEEGELEEGATIKDYLIVQQEGTRQVVFAEGQAMRRVPMYMTDWIEKLHGFLNLNDRAILTHAGQISHELALQKAEMEYALYDKKSIAQEDAADGEFEMALKNLPSPKKKKK